MPAPTPYRLQAKLFLLLSVLLAFAAPAHATSTLNWQAAIGLRVDIDGTCESAESQQSETQHKSATHTLTGEGCKVRLLVTVSGAVEAHNSSYDQVSLNGVMLFEGDNLGQECDISNKTSTVAIEVGTGDAITLSYNTVDSLFNQGLFAQITAIVEDPVACDSCSGGAKSGGSSSGGGTAAFGGSAWGVADDGAASFAVGLGTSSSTYGGTALYADADPTDAASAGREAVRYIGSDESHIAETFKDTNGKLDQVKGADGLVALADSTGGYTLSFYSPDQITGFNSTTGRYNVTGSPDKTLAVARTTSGTSATLTYTETVGSGSPLVLVAHTYDTATDTRTLNEFDGQRITLTTETALSGARTEKRTTIKSLVASVEKTHSIRSEIRETFAWGDEVTSEALDPDALNLVTTYTYYTDSVNDGDNYTRLKSVLTAEGSWTLYRDYDADGTPGKIVRQFASNALDTSPAGEAANWLETTTTASADEDGDSLPDLTRTTTRHLKGQLVSREWRTDYTATTTKIYTAHEHFYTSTFRRLVTERAANATAARGDTGNSVTTEFIDAITHQTIARIDPRGITTLTFDRIYPAYSGVTRVSIRAEGWVNTSGTLAGGWVEISHEDATGNLTTTTRDAATGYVLHSRTPTNPDAQGRAQRVDFNDGSYEEYVHGCCGLEEKRHRDGSRTTYLRDAMKRPVEEIVTVDGAFVSATLTVLDPLNRVVATGRRPSATGTVQITSEIEYDLAGRLTHQRDALARETSYAYTTDTSGRPVTTTTAPGDGTRIETREKSGALRTLGGTAANPRRHVEDIDGTGHHRIEYFIGESGAETEWVRTDYDFFGRPWKTTYPYPTGAAAYTYYNAAGQITRTEDPDGVTRLFAYDTLGRQEYVATDLDDDDQLDLNGTDRVTRYAYDIDYTSGQRAPRVTAYALTTNGQITERQLWRRTTRFEDGEVLRTQDPSGTTTRVFEHRTHDVKLTETTPDSRTTATVFKAGRPATIIITAGGTTLSDLAYTYDDYARLATHTDAAFGTTTYAYHADDQIHTLTTADPDPDPAQTGPGKDPQTTTHIYDTAGLLWKTTLPDDRVETRTYHPTGRLKLLYGGDNCPQKFTYDPQGRMKTLTTWQTFDPGTATGTLEAITTWNYHPQRGWLANKRHADNQGPTYTHTPAGRLATRAWARSLTTTYGYTDAGDLETIDYSDATPDAAFTYDREGRLATTTDAAGLLTRTHNALGQLDDETYTATGELAGQQITRDFDGFLRLETLGIGHSSLGIPNIVHGYGTDTRLATITQGSFAATQAYRTNSSVPTGLTHRQGSTVRATLDKNHDLLGRITRADTSAGATLVARRDYAYNQANQRVAVTHEDGRVWRHAYDPLGQLVSSEKEQANTDPLPGHALGYTFDTIGNRTATTTNGRTETYTPDPLNRYTRRTTSGAVDVRGTAATDATLLVNNLPATRTGADFYRAAEVDNRTRAINAEIKVQAVRLGPPVTVGTTTSAVRVEPAVLDHAYDADGNQLGYGHWSYEWDGENRLKAAEVSPGVQGVFASLPRYRIEYAYDAFSRRIAKTVKVRNTADTGWDTTAKHRYLYDGWNKVAELDALAANAVIRTHAWSLDLSATPQGAGGVGGLLWTNTPSASYAPGYDANGNIVAWVKLNDGTLAGTAEYGPFGEPLATSGVARDLPHAFSTKFRDLETGLYDYGHRSYQPSSGRWLSRDPIEEGDGPNLYAFVRNTPLQYVDKDGRSAVIVVGGAAIIGAGAYAYYEWNRDPVVPNTPYFTYNHPTNGPTTFINKCNIVIFIGHDTEVPQNRVVRIGGICSAGAASYQCEVPNSRADPAIPRNNPDIPGAPPASESLTNPAQAYSAALTAFAAAKAAACQQLSCCRQITITLEPVSVNAVVGGPMGGPRIQETITCSR